MTTTPQAQMLISLKDSEFWPADMSLNKWADLVCDELRRLDAENQRLQAILAKLQPAQEPVQSIPPGLRVGDSHMESLIEAAIQGHAGTRDAMRWLVRQIARVEDKPAQAGELPDDSIPAIGCGFWIDRISVENLRRIHRSESATAMISALINATDAIEDAQALISSLRAALAARKPLSADEPQYRLLRSDVDQIEASDEFLSEDTKTWAIDHNGIFVGMVYGGRVLRPARRRINGLEVKT